MSIELSNFITRNFKKRKKEAKKLLDEGLVNRDELIVSIRAKRKELAGKRKNYKYRDEVTENEMIIILAIRLDK